MAAQFTLVTCACISVGKAFCAKRYRS